MNKYLVLSDGNSPHTLKWVKELNKYFDIYIISFNGFSKEIQDQIESDKLFDLRTDVMIGGGNIRVLKHISKVASLVNSIHPDYINAHYITSYGTVACIVSYLTGYTGKLILSTWGSDVLVTPNKNPMYFYLTKLLLKKADIITSDSDYMTKKIQEIYKKTNVLTFPFGIEKFPDVEIEDKNEFLFFSSRALEPNYNIAWVIQVFFYLHSKDSRRKLIIAHDGREKSALVELAENFGIKDSVKFVGFLNAKQQECYYKKCKYYFTLPMSDSTSVSLLESMAYGCTPIVSDIPANREWIEDGINGIVLKEDDSIQLDKFMIDGFYANREKIEKRAIWSNNIKEYIKSL